MCIDQVPVTCSAQNLMPPRNVVPDQYVECKCTVITPRAFKEPYDDNWSLPYDIPHDLLCENMNPLTTMVGGQGHAAPFEVKMIPIPQTDTFGAECRRAKCPFVKSVSRSLFF